MVFTTWAAYLAELKNVLANATAAGFVTLNQFGAVGPDGVPATFRSLDDVRRWIQYVEGKVAAENVAATGRGRILFCGGVQ